MKGDSLDAEYVGDLSHGVFALVVEPLCSANLVWGEFGSSASFAASCAGCCEAVTGVGGDEFGLELGEYGEHAERGSAFSGAGVDALFHGTRALSSESAGDRPIDLTGQPVIPDVTGPGRWTQRLPSG